MLSIIKRMIRRSMIKGMLAFYYLVRWIYWGIVKVIVRLWKGRGLHLVSIGQFVSGEWKKRSLFREDMILKSIPLFVALRGKSCLDIACNDGYWSFRLGRYGIEELVGVDLGEQEVLRADFLKTVYNFPGFQFYRRDIFKFLYEENDRTYDIILLLSLIYHLPEQTDWEKFFSTICQINNDCLIIDSRWFDDEEYWYDKTSERTIIRTRDGILKKWRPKREDVLSMLGRSGYNEVIELNPSCLLADQKEAFGDGDPYSKQNVSDYITNNRTLLIANKKKSSMSNVINNLHVQVHQFHDKESEASTKVSRMKGKGGISKILRSTFINLKVVLTCVVLAHILMSLMLINVWGESWAQIVPNDQASINELKGHVNKEVNEIIVEFSKAGDVNPLIFGHNAMGYERCRTTLSKDCVTDRRHSNWGTGLWNPFLKKPDSELLQITKYIAIIAAIALSYLYHASESDDQERRELI